MHCHISPTKGAHFLPPIGRHSLSVTCVKYFFQPAWGGITYSVGLSDAIFVSLYNQTFRSREGHLLPTVGCHSLLVVCVKYSSYPEGTITYTLVLSLHFCQLCAHIVILLWLERSVAYILSVSLFVSFVHCHPSNQRGTSLTAYLVRLLLALCTNSHPSLTRKKYCLPAEW